MSLTFTPFENAILDVMKGKHDFATDSLKLYLTNTAPNAATMQNKVDLAEIATGNGYAGPLAVTTDSLSQTGGTASLAVTLPASISGTGGTIATFRYIVLFNDTDVNDALISYWDYGEAVNVKDGETFNFALSGANILTGQLVAAL
jgi:hypothetical protein